MLISASRRTDIAAFYTPWFMNRVRAGFCTVPNPMNRKQISEISLAPENVDAFVFWTRDPRPLLTHLTELDERGFNYYFQFSLLGYPRLIDPKSPATKIALTTFRQLAQRISPERVIWRYDPILFSQLTPPSYHEDQFARLAQELRGSTRRCVLSVVDIYRKLQGRLRKLADTPAAFENISSEKLHGLLERLAVIAEADGMEISSCAEAEDWSPWSVPPGKCVDAGLANRLFGLSLPDQKDPRQREACGCVVSRDIGMYDSCLFGCSYCYATTSFARARDQFAGHDPESPSLV